jgi:purine catabolism regulator
LVDQVAATLGTWAQLSDYAGRVVASSAGLDPVGEQPSSEVPVLVDGTAWGRLSVGTASPAEVLVEAVLDRAPTVLGLCLIREQKEVAGALRAQQLLLNQLVANQSVEIGLLKARLRAAGVATSNHQYVCIAVDPQRVGSAARVVDALIREVGHGIFGLVDGTLCALLAGHADGASPNLADCVGHSLRDALAAQSRLCATVSRAVREVAELPRTMAETRNTLAMGQELHVNEPVVGVQTLALERLLSARGDDDAMRQFVDEQIGVLERADSAKGGQLSLTLDVLIACGGSKAAAAKRLHIRRQSLYYRLDQISKMLGIDLDDPKQLMTLSVAVTARRMLYAGGQ